MSYTVEDVNGEKMPGPTISGLNAIRSLLQKQNAESFPATSHLLEFGHTNKLIALAVECDALASKAKDKAIQHSLKELAKYARDFNRSPGNILLITN